MSFQNYLAECKAPNSAAGDAVRLLRKDLEVPKIMNAADLEAYLQGINATSSVCSAAGEVWQGYCKHNIRAPKRSTLDLINPL